MPGASTRTTSGCSTPARRPTSWPPPASGARRTPRDCAAIHPGRLVRGLADAVVRRGVALYERTPATAIAPGRVVTRHGIVRAEHVIRATEGYTRSLDGRAPPAGAGLLADHRHRAAAGRDLGADRAAPARDVQRPPAPDHLRPAHRRRPVGLRRPGRAVPLRLADPAGVRPVPSASSPPCTPRSSTCSRCVRDVEDDPSRGAARSASPATGRPRSGSTRHRHRLGRRLRRRRRQHHQPGRPDPGRPRARAATPS